MSFADTNHLLYVRTEQWFVFKEFEVYNGSEVSQYLADTGVYVTSSAQEIGPQAYADHVCTTLCPANSIGSIQRAGFLASGML